MASTRPPRYGSVATARRVGISLRQLYYWVNVLRAVRPEVRRHGRRRFRHFTDRDLRTLRAIARLLDRGYTLRAAILAARR
jgi:DNA-binding transcriptional MerR regulator